MKNRRVLVTGGCGFIGSHIVDRLTTSGHDVVVIDDLSAPQNDEFYFNESAAYHCLDLVKDDCRDSFEDVAAVFHVAARSRIQPTIDSPASCFEVNVLGTQRVLDWSKDAGIEKIIYSSTSSLYGRENQIPYSPNMPADCLNPYSLSKWMGELMCQLYTQLYDIDTVILRYFNVYGPREPLKGCYAPVVGLLKRQFAKGEPMTIVGDGEQRRDFTYIDDVVAANILALKKDTPGHKVYNIGTGKNYSINQIAELVGGTEAVIRSIPLRPAEVRETLADIEETKMDLQWIPQYSLEDKITSY